MMLKHNLKNIQKSSLTKSLRSSRQQRNRKTELNEEKDTEIRKDFGTEIRKDVGTEIRKDVVVILNENKSNSSNSHFSNGLYLDSLTTSKKSNLNNLYVNSNNLYTNANISLIKPKVLKKAILRGVKKNAIRNENDNLFPLYIFKSKGKKNPPQKVRRVRLRRLRTQSLQIEAAEEKIMDQSPKNEEQLKNEEQTDESKKDEQPEDQSKSELQTEEPEKSEVQPKNDEQTEEQHSLEIKQSNDELEADIKSALGKLSESLNSIQSESQVNSLTCFRKKVSFVWWIIKYFRPLQIRRFFTMMIQIFCLH